MSASNPNPTGAGQPVTSVTTSDLAVTPVPTNPNATSGAQPVIPAHEAAVLHPSQSADSAAGTGVEGEIDVWIGRYSMLNFLDRIIVRTLLTLGVLFMAWKAWGSGTDVDHHVLQRFTYLLAGIVAIMWVYLFVQMIRAWYSHFYRLTNRRLFVSSGIVSRRRTMLELLRVNDVTMRQNSLLDRWFGLGTVIVLSSEKGSPQFIIPGVKNPKAVLDLIWHHARTERDLRSVKVDQV